MRYLCCNDFIHLFFGPHLYNFPIFFLGVCAYRFSGSFREIVEFLNQKELSLTLDLESMSRYAYFCSF